MDFGAICDLNDVSLDIRKGKVLGLMGDNGAGKSTVFKTIAGNFQPTAGKFTMESTQLSLTGPADARRHAIDVVYQDLALCDNSPPLPTSSSAEK